MRFVFGLVLMVKIRKLSWSLNRFGLVWFRFFDHNPSVAMIPLPVLLKSAAVHGWFCGLNMLIKNLKFELYSNPIPL